MKVTIKGHTQEDSMLDWWYADHIGEAFEVEEDEKKPGYYYTMIDGEKHHILKVDCEESE